MFRYFLPFFQAHARSGEGQKPGSLGDTRLSAACHDVSLLSGEKSAIYDLTFWLAYLSNALVSAGNTLLCRYADYVNFLGADEFHLGWIIGFGMVGSLIMRFALGHSIDRFGARRIWLLTIVATTLGCVVHLGINDYRGPAIYLARVLYIISLAGVFSASMTLISARAPKQRMAEVIGIYGSAGFAGILLGAPLADLLFPAGITSVWESRLLFLTAGGLCLLSLPLAWVVPPERAPRKHESLARNGNGHIIPRSSAREPSVIQLVIRYASVPTVIAGVIAGAALSVPPTFLPRYVAEFGGHSVSGFLFLYAATAIVIRGTLLPRISDIRLDRMIMLGTVILCVSQALFLIVQRPWQLVFPGLVFGIAHAFLFPAIVAAGSSTFPKRHRGLATTLMMATFDAGLLVGGPLAGITLRLAGDLGWPRYPTMFFVMSASLVFFALYFLGTMKSDGKSQMTRRRNSRTRLGSQLRLISPGSPPGLESTPTRVANIASNPDIVVTSSDSQGPAGITVSPRMVQANDSTSLDIAGAVPQPRALPQTEPITSSA